MRFALAQASTVPATSATSKLQVRWNLAGLCLVIAAGLWADTSALFSFPHAVGADGYYYVLQINSLLTKGHFYFPTHTPLVLYALASISYLTGDPILSVKFVSISLHALMVLGIFAFVSATTRSLWLGLTGATLALASGTHLYMIAEYVNQLGAFTLLVWGGWCGVRALNTRSRVWMLPALACLVAAGFSHRSAFPLALTGAVALALIYLLYLQSIDRTYRFIIWVALLLLWCAPAVLASQTFISLPTWFQEELLTRPGLPLGRAAVAEQIILMVVSPSVLILLFFQRHKSRDRLATVILGSVALLSLLITVNPFLNYSKAMSFAWRLSVMAYIQVAILVPGLLWLVYPSRKAALLIAAFVLPLMAGSRVYAQPFGLRSDYLSARAAMLQRLPLYRQQLEPNPLIISPHGEQFVVTHALDVPAQQKRPEDGQPRTVYWLLHSVRPNFLLPSVLVVMQERKGTYTVLAKDSDVRRQLKTLSEGERRWLLMNNPLLNEVMAQEAHSQAQERLSIIQQVSQVKAVTAVT